MQEWGSAAVVFVGAECGWLIVAVLSFVVHVVPAIHCPHYLFVTYPVHSSSLLFNIPHLHCPCHLVFVCWCLFVGIVICCPGSIVISTTIVPYKQWLTGRVVVLCDMAPHCCCHPEWGPLCPCEQMLTAAAWGMGRHHYTRQESKKKMNIS
jgi:hypothetical protein